MANQIITVTNLDKTTTVSIIVDHGGGNYTSMLKTFYDAQAALAALALTQNVKLP